MTHHAAVAHDARKIVQCENGMDAGHRSRCLSVDPGDSGARVRAAHEACNQHPGQYDIVDELALPAQQRQILDAADTLSDQLWHEAASNSGQPNY
jgi:hypothetical protein